jgi:hypothetical protein
MLPEFREMGLGREMPWYDWLRLLVQEFYWYIFVKNVLCSS